MRTADAGFQHPAAPHGDAVILAEIVNAVRHCVPSNPAQLDIDDLAGAEFDCGACLLFGVDAFI